MEVKELTEESTSRYSLTHGPVTIIFDYTFVGRNAIHLYRGGGVCSTIDIDDIPEDVKMDLIDLEP